MAQRIFPSENDVHDTSGAGLVPTEANLTLLNRMTGNQYSHFRDTVGAEMVGPGGVHTGFDFSSGSATSVTLTAGTANIDGFSVEDTSTIVGTLVASQFNYVFLTIDKTSSLATGLSLTVIDIASFNAAVANPANSILLWCFETDGSSIITQFDFRTVGSNVLTGKYTGSGAATKTFDLGFRPKMVHVYRNEDNQFCAQSPLAVPRQSSSFVQRGVFHGQVQLSGLSTVQSPMVSQMTDDPELVPIIVENGFTVEDGPGGLSTGPVWLTVDQTFDPPSTAAGATFDRSVTLTGAVSTGALVLASHTNLGYDWELQRQETRVTAANTVNVQYKNVSGGTLDPAIGTLIVHVLEPSKVDLWSLNETAKNYFFIAWF